VTPSERSESNGGGAGSNGACPWSSSARDPSLVALERSLRRRGVLAPRAAAAQSSKPTQTCLLIAAGQLVVLASAIYLLVT
jgi:hypothetical protein